MTQPAVKGWCPGALRPMPGGDGLIVRLKPCGAGLSLQLAAHIAEWSRRWGNGQLDLSSRANLQLRGVSWRTLPGLQQALAERGLLDATAAGEAVRNVLLSPLAGLDPAAVLDIRPFGRALRQRLAADAALHALPAKFGFLIADGGRLNLRGVPADVRFEAVRTDHGEAFLIGLDGAPTQRFGPCQPPLLPAIAAALATTFISHRDRLGPGIARMRDLVAAIGAIAVARQAGLRSVAWDGGRDARGPPPALAAPGCHSLGDGAVLGIALAFGRVDAADLAHLATAAAAHGGTELRLTPWRTILAPMPSIASARSLATSLAATPALICDPADTRRRVAACTGAPGCPHGSTDVRGDATVLAGLIGNAADRGIELHVSGCTKGCAHPAAAPITLVGRDGCYDLVRAGRPSDPPMSRGLTPDMAMAAVRRIMEQAGGGPVC